MERRAHGLRLRARHGLERSTACYSRHARPATRSARARWPEFQLGENVSALPDRPDEHRAGVHGAAHADIALRVADVAEARRELEAKGVEFDGDTFDTGVCHMAFFPDPDGNALMLHRRYAPHD